MNIIVAAFAGLNWLAIALATLAYFVLGALWFTPLFGRAWDASLGVRREQGQRYPPIYYVVPLIGCFAVTLATSVLASALELAGLADAVLLGLVVGVGVAAAVTFTNAVTPNTPRPLLFGAVTGGYHVVGIVAAAMVVVGMSG